MIPARKGSTGLLGKNALTIGGKSLTQIAMQCAVDSGVFSEVVLSSDWPELLDQARLMGVKAIERPVTLADSDATIDDVLAHVLGTMDTSDLDSACVLNPTSPFRAPQDVQAAYKLFNKLHPQGVVSVVPVKPLFMSRLRRGKRALWHNANFSFRNRQRRKPLFMQNGAIYIVDAGYFSQSGRLVGDKVATYVMDKWRSHDVDDSWDFLTAQAWYPEIQRVRGQEIYDVKPEPAEAAPPAEPGEVTP